MLPVFSIGIHLPSSDRGLKNLFFADYGERTIACPVDRKSNFPFLSRLSIRPRSARIGVENRKPRKESASMRLSLFADPAIPSLALTIPHTNSGAPSNTCNFCDPVRTVLF